MLSKNNRLKEKYEAMKIALPLAGGKLSLHFGHCENFALFDVDPTEKKIFHREDIASPPHEPGLLPGWLAERGTSVVITGGMGQRAQQLFAQHGISVVIGAPADAPERIVGDYLAGRLQVGGNVCDH
jgi:predicted Fe-Mo cluster-binding NifX family protein